MSDTAVGISMLVVAGVMNANFTLPLKFSRRWAWENSWLAWTILALLVFPPVVAYAMVPDLGDVYIQVGLFSTLIVVACGLGWGIGQVFLGLAVQSIGIGLAFAIILGISAAVGSLIDLATKHADKVHSQAGMAIILGVVLVLVGVGLCAAAGRRREIVLGTVSGTSFGRGLIFCCIAGVGSALVGLGLAWGAPLIRAAKSTGTPEIWRPMAVWLPLMVAGAIPNVIYAVHLIRKNGTGQKFREPGFGGSAALSAVMAILWFGSTVLYGMSISYMGTLGDAIAWPLYMSLIVITASMAGLLTGEWRNTGKAPVRIQWAGVMVLIVAAIVLSRGI